MSAKLIYVTIGEHIICVSEQAKNGKNVHVYRQFICETPPDCIQDGQIVKHEALVEALKPQFAQHKIKPKALVFTVASTKVAFREVLLPLVKDNRIASIIEANAEDYFPVDIEKYHLTHARLEDVERDGQKRARVMAYAAPLTLLEPYFVLAKALGGKIKAIDYAGNSQYQALKHFPGDEPRIYVYADTASVQMTFIRDGRLMLQRSLPVGCMEYIQDYMALANLPPERFLPTLERLSSADGEALLAQSMSEEAAEEALSRLGSGVSRSIGYFNQSYWETPVASVAILGPCGRLAGLQAAIEKHTGLPTEHIDTLQATLGAAAHWRDGCVYLNNVGAAIAPLDLIPPAYQDNRKKDKTEKKQSVRTGVMLLVFCAVASFALWYTADAKLGEAKKANEERKQRIADLEYTEIEHDVHQTYIQGVQVLLEVELMGASYNDQLANFLEELEEKMPSGIVTLSMNCTAENVSFNATVPTKEDAAAVLVQLRGFDSIGSISIPGITENRDETGMSYVSFSVTCTYKPLW